MYDVELFRVRMDLLLDSVVAADDILGVMSMPAAKEFTEIMLARQSNFEFEVLEYVCFWDDNDIGRRERMKWLTDVSSWYDEMLEGIMLVISEKDDCWNNENNVGRVFLCLCTARNTLMELRSSL